MIVKAIKHNIKDKKCLASLIIKKMQIKIKINQCIFTQQTDYKLRSLIMEIIGRYVRNACHRWSINWYARFWLKFNSIY